MDMESKEELTAFISKYLKCKYLSFLGTASVALKYSQLPLMRLIQVMQSTKLKTSLMRIKRDIPWVSATELALIAHSIQRQGTESGPYFDRILQEVRDVEQGFLLLDAFSTHVGDDEEQRARIAFLAKILRGLHPCVLQSFGQYLDASEVGKEQDELALVAAKRVLIDDAWRSQCYQEGFSVLENVESPLSWKVFYISQAAARLSSRSIFEERESAVIETLFLIVENRQLLETAGVDLF